MLIKISIFLIYLISGSSYSCEGIQVEKCKIETSSDFIYKNHKSLIEQDIINLYILNLKSIRDMVKENFDKKWWSPSKDDVVRKISNFIDDLEIKNLSDFTIEEVEGLPYKVNLAAMVIQNYCSFEFEKLKSNLASITELALNYKREN